MTQKSLKPFLISFIRHSTRFRDCAGGGNISRPTNEKLKQGPGPSNIHNALHDRCPCVALFTDPHNTNDQPKDQTQSLEIKRLYHGTNYQPQDRSRTAGTNGLDRPLAALGTRRWLFLGNGIVRCQQISGAVSWIHQERNRWLYESPRETRHQKALLQTSLYWSLWACGSVAH